MGGTRAKKALGSMAQREQELQTRSADMYEAEQRMAASQTALSEDQAAVAAREKVLQEREAAFAEFEEGMLRKLEEDYHRIVSTVQHIRRAVHNAQRTLSTRREHVLHYENFSDSLQGIYGQGNHLQKLHSLYTS